MRNKKSFKLHDTSKQPLGLDECKCIYEDETRIQQNCQKQKQKIGGMVGRDKNRELIIWITERRCKGKIASSVRVKHFDLNCQKHTTQKVELLTIN